MATADGSTACGGGAGGKFRKRPFRRPQTTPYDRPPTALRVARRNDDNSSTGGWLSRIVNPASELITSSAHKLFSSVFRKRLLPPPPPQPSQDEVETLENHLGNTTTEVPSRIQERDVIQGNMQNNDSTADGVEELEHILKQNTFTRSEIDRLTELLHSRTVDKSATEGQRRFELTPSEPPAGHSRQKELFGTAFENGVNHSQFPGTELIPAVRSKVNVNDVASPTNIAKAYMGSRSSRVSPSVLGPISHAVREETPAFTALKLHRPSVSTVQIPSSSAGTYQKDIVLRRSQGRSAIYSMARTPYSRVQSTVSKGPGTSSDAFDGQSLLSSQKVLKRRSSVLENDIGTVGPVRRTRQKPNLLFSKTSGPSSSTAFPYATPSGVAEASSSKSQENRGEKGIPFSSPHISSKSIEMGQRILHQLEKLTPPKDKSNEKKPGLSGGIPAMELTPAMLRGQARKSLETVDSLKYVQHGEAGGNMVDSLNASREMQDFSVKEQDKFYDCSSKVLNSSSKIYPENDEARIADNDVTIISKNTVPVVLKTAVDVPRKSPAFQMSAYEDYLDLDDDVHLNGAASPTTETNRNLGISSVHSNGKLSEHPAFPGMEPPSDLVSKKITTVDSSNFAEKGIGHSFSMDSALNRTIGTSIPSLQPLSDKADIPASTTSFGINRSDKVSPPLFITSPVMESSITKDVTSSVFAAASTDAAIQSPGSNKKSTDAVNLSKQSDEPGSSAGAMSSLGSLSLPSSAPSPVLFSFQSSSIGSSAHSTLTTAIGVSAGKAGSDAADNATATAAISVSSNSLAGSSAFPSFQATFGGSSAVSDSSTLASSGTDAAEKSKVIAGGNLPNGKLSGAASVTTQGPAIASFQFGATTSSTNSQLQGSQNFSSRSVFGDQNLPSTTASVSAISSVPSQPSVSAISSVPSQPPVSALPALSGTSSLVNSSSLTSVSVPFSSSSSASSTVPASRSTSSTSTNMFDANWQSTSSSVFGSVLNNASSGLGFGASSAPAASTSASFGLAFGTSSISAPANGSSAAGPFGSFSASAAAGSSSATPGLMFGASAPTPSSSVSSGFTFGTSSITAPANGSPNGVPFRASSISAASGSTPSVFGFGASSAASSSASSSPFSFGASSTSAASSAPSSPFSFGASSTSASSSSPSSTFSFGASSTSASSSALPSTFSFGASSSSASSAPSSAFSFGASSTSASSSAPSSTFSFGASSTSASSNAPSSAFSFGVSSASSSAPFSFGASSPVTATPAPAFSFGAAAQTPAPTSLQPSQPAFGGANSVFGFGSAPSPSPLGSSDQMTMEDSMVEDSMQSHAAATPTPIFGQSPTNNFSFGMAQAPAPVAAPLGASPFQFSGQQSQVAAAPSPFQASGSFDGGSFSLGAGGNDKSNRRIVKVNKNRNRKK